MRTPRLLEADNGNIVLGANVTRSYFAQRQSEILDASLTVLQTLLQVGSSLGRTQLQTILGGFRFSGDDVDKKTSVLSGGERSRLALARMLTAPTSLLLLDEPTNHLDMKSCAVLSAALEDYEGAICVISHDRDFLYGFVNRVWKIKDGVRTEYLGNYSDYEWKKSQALEQAALRLQPSQPVVNGKTARPTKARFFRRRVCMS